MTSLWTFFLGNFNYFRTVTENIFLEVCFCSSRKLRTAGLHPQRESHSILFRILKILKYPFFSDDFQKTVSNGIFSFIKRKLHFIHFSECFPNFSVQLFQNSLLKTSVMEFWAVNHSPVFHLNYDNILYDKA